jgi:hypothetical protein
MGGFGFYNGHYPSSAPWVGCYRFRYKRALIFSKLLRHLVEKGGPSLKFVAPFPQERVLQLYPASLSLSAELCDEYVAVRGCMMSNVVPPPA